jgi:hypothetical protein
MLDIQTIRSAIAARLKYQASDVLATQQFDR